MNFRRIVPHSVVVLVLWISCLTLGTAEVAPGGVPEKSERLPGVELSQGVTEVTGVAISPLLGVSSVGAWRYFRTEAGARPGLPWFCHPAAWGCGFGILLICFLKDSLGTAVPGLLKKPLDMVELFENKASALVASTAFVPLIAREMAEHFQASGEGGPMALLVPVASMTGASWLAVSTTVVFVIASVLAFFAVWLSGHAINVLIILSPFSLVDAVLKLCRLAVIALIGAAYLIAPWLAAVICLGIIVLAVWMAPATLRLATFGTRYAGDVLLPWIGRKRATDDQPHAFTMGRFPGLPVRTSGRLVTDGNGAIGFRHRPWGIGKPRFVPLPAGQPVLAKGLLSPALAVCHPENPSGSKVLLLLPRYRGREDAVSRHLEIGEIRDHALSRGFTAIRTWWNEQTRRKTGRIAESP